MRHGQYVLEGILVCDVEKTLSGINRIVLNGRHETTVADFFSQAPWHSDDIGERSRWWLLWWTLEGLCRSCRPGERLKGVVIIDDTGVPKGKTRRKFEPVGKYRDVSRPGVAYCYGCCFVNCHIGVAGYALAFSGRLYLKEETVRQWNRGKKGEERRRFRSEYQLVQEMLAELAEGGRCHSLAEVLREHRRTQEEATLRAMCEMVLQTGDIEAALAKFLP
jgi:hypothetical protein